MAAAFFNLLISLMPVLIIIGNSFVTLAHGHNCYIYCLKSCGDYFESSGSEFKDCVSAHIDCNCHGSSLLLRDRGFDGFVVIFLISISMVVCCCLCYLCRIRSTRPHHGHTVVARPVVRSVGNGNEISRRNQPGAVTNGTSYSTHLHAPSYRTPAPLTTFVIVTSSPVSQKPPSPPLPEEYLAPPSYYECTGIDDSNSQSLRVCL